MGYTPVPPETVVAIRERYEELRLIDVAEACKPDTRLSDISDSGRDKTVAAEFGLSHQTVRNIVLGLSRRSVGGPIDHARLRNHEQYTADIATYGAEIANDLRRLRRRGFSPDTAPKAPEPSIFVTVRDRLGNVVAEHPLEPGHTLTTSIRPNPSTTDPNEENDQ